VASLERHLQQLEIQADTLQREDEAAVSEAVLRRLTYEELGAYEEALSRSLSRGNSPRRTGPSWSG